MAQFSASSIPPASTFRNKKPFGEHVEGYVVEILADEPTVIIVDFENDSSSTGRRTLSAARVVGRS